MNEINNTFLTTDLRNPNELKPHPDNPRGEISADSIEVAQLAEDIKKRGLIQPIVITQNNFILAGHRRRIAAIIAGLELVPVVLRELGQDEFAEEFFLAENMQRQDLSPLEEAKAIQRLQQKLEKQSGKTLMKTDLSRRLNLPAQTINQRLAILELPERVQTLFHGLELPILSALKLAKLKDYPEEVEKFADRLAARQITLNALDTLITRRLPELKNLALAETTLKQKEKLGRIKHHYPENHHTPVFSRKGALESLENNSHKSIDLFKVRVLFDQTCCNCGMMGSEAVCQTCPLPKFINGLVGRSESAKEAAGSY